MATPNYVLIADWQHSQGHQDTKVLPKGAFVRPIKLCYVPKHVKEDPRWRNFNEYYDVFCHTHIGIVPIRYDEMRQV